MIPKFKFGNTSKARLRQCHPDLQKLMEAVIAESPEDIAIVCGGRGQGKQDKAYAEGKSKLKYPNSKHNIQPSMAVDVAPYIDGGIPWDDISAFIRLRSRIRAKSHEMKLIIRSGSYFSFEDWSHYELDWIKR